MSTGSGPTMMMFLVFYYLLTNTVAFESTLDCGLQDQELMEGSMLLQVRQGKMHSSLLKLASQQICENNFWMTWNTCLQPLSDGTAFVLTGDIPDMWIRDSSAQLWPYLKFASAYPTVRILLEGALRRQAFYISSAPYANAFTKERRNLEMIDKRLHRQDYIATYNYEVDSNAYFLRFLAALVEQYPDTALLHDDFVLNAVSKTIALYRLERHHFAASKYRYPEWQPWELPGEDGRGNPVNYTGLIWGAFRPSDDAQQLGYSIPSNLFVASNLKPIERIAREAWKNIPLAEDISELRTSILDGVKKFGTTRLHDGTEVYCYEVDGLGSCLLMDDANVPSLLSLPYFDEQAETFDRLIYQNTRRFILSKRNPWYFEGSIAKGIGSHHTGEEMIWPMSLIMQAITAENDQEQQQVLSTLLDLDPQKHGFTESVNQDDPNQVTRPWFAWPNALFAELMITKGLCQPDMMNAQVAPPLVFVGSEIFNRPTLDAQQNRSKA